MDRLTLICGGGRGWVEWMVKVVIEHVDAWPFKEPVDAREVPDYYEVIKDPVGEYHLQPSCGSTLMREK